MKGVEVTSGETRRVFENAKFLVRTDHWLEVHRIDVKEDTLKAVFPPGCWSSAINVVLDEPKPKSEEELRSEYDTILFAAAGNPQ